MSAASGPRIIASVLQATVRSEWCRYGEEIEERAEESAALAAAEAKAARRLEAQERRRRLKEVMDQPFAYGL